MTLGDTKSEWEETYFVPVCCFVLYNFGDYLGKELATRLKWPKPNKLGQLIVLVMSVLRIVFIPLFIYCNVAPANRSTKVGKMINIYYSVPKRINLLLKNLDILIFPFYFSQVVFKSEWWYIGFMLIFSISNGYVGNIAFMFTPKVVSAEYQDIAASFAVAMLVGGCGLGSIISTPVVNAL